MEANPTWLAWLAWMCLVVCVEGRFDGTWLHSTALPCVYESRLVTDKNWYGFLANITFGAAGRLTFEFSYPAAQCCQNILFYSDQQVTQISDRLNCWQREYMLNPEEEQILRLTPKFSWSGCHMTHPNDVATYVCKGGRSFIRESVSAIHPITWYIAVSNCHTMSGLELTYRIEAYGQVGECKTKRHTLRPAWTTVTSSSSSNDDVKYPYPQPALATRRPDPTPAPSTAATLPPIPPRPVCRVEGELNTSSTWYGFIANISIGPLGGGFAYRLSYPYDMQVQNVVLYGEEDMLRLGWSSTQCWYREAVIKPHHLHDKVIDLSYRSTWSGCASMNSSQGRNLTCQGERKFDGPRRLFVAVSNCRSTSGLLLSYRFDVFGFDSEMCVGSRAPDALRTSGGVVTLSVALMAMVCRVSAN